MCSMPSWASARPTWVGRLRSTATRCAEARPIGSVHRLCRAAGVARIDAGPKGAVLKFRSDTAIDPERLIVHVANPTHGLRFRPDNKLVITRNWPVADQRLDGVQRVLSTLGEMVV